MAGAREALDNGWFMTDEASDGICRWDDHVFGKDLRLVLVPGFHVCKRCGLTVTVQ